MTRKANMAKMVWVVITMLLALATICLADITTTLNFSPSEFSFKDLTEQDGNIYSVIEVTGNHLYQAPDSTGNPETPMATFAYVLPQGQEIDRVVVNSVSEISLGNAPNCIRPVQTKWQTSATALQPAFVPADNVVYRRNAMYPSIDSIISVAGQCYVRGVSIATISARPIRYNPVTQEVTMFERIDVTIVTKPAATRPLLPEQQSEKASAELLKFLGPLVKNYNDLPGSIPPVPATHSNPGSYGFPLPNGVQPVCVILTNIQLAGGFNRFAKWLTAKGTPTEIVIIDTVYNNYPGIDDQEKIRNFAIDRYRRHGLIYLILGGDLSVIPGRLCYPGNTSTPPSIEFQQICDLYYADLNGEWDYDHDGTYGEYTQDHPDIGPEIFVGRTTVQITNQISSWTDKRIRFEKTPGNGEYSYLTKVNIISADQMRDLNEHTGAARAFPLTFNADTLMIEQPSGSATVPTGPHGLDVVAHLSSVFAQFVIQQNHGSSPFYRTCSPGYNNGGSGFSSHIDAIYPNSGWDDGWLENVDPQGHDYVTFSIACCLGQMDCLESIPGETRFPCFAQADLISPAGSVCATYNTRWGWVSASYRLDVAKLNLLFSEQGQHVVSYAHFGAKILCSNYLDIAYGNTLFGDPTMAVWTEQPRTMTVDYPRSLRLIPNQSQTVNVQVRSGGMPVKGVSVTLWKEKGRDVYATGQTDASGRIRLVIKPRSAGNISLVCSKVNFIPVERTIIMPRQDYIPNGNTQSKVLVTKPCLIWNPLQHASGDSLLSVLRRAGYEAIQTDDLSEYSNDLPNYLLFVMGGIGEYNNEAKITQDMIQPYLSNILSFLDGNGALYWEGGWSLMWQEQSLRDYFSFDIYPAVQDTATYLEGADSFFAIIESIGYNEGSSAADAISHYPNDHGNILRAPEAHWPPANTKAAVNSNGFRVVVTNFSWAKLHDELINTRSQLAEIIIQWLTNSTGTTDTPTSLPIEFALAQNYPNPFNAATIFSFALPSASHVTLTVYNTLGQKVTCLANAEFMAGQHQIIWDVSESDVVSGMYFAILTNGQETKKIKLTLLK